MEGSSKHGSRDHHCLIIGGIITLILFEIKREIREIEKKLDNPRFGLEEIKWEIREIEAKLDNPDTGLTEIKREIREIEAKLDNPDFGLEEIKREIREIETELGRSSVLTTGPILRSAGVGNVYVKVTNNTAVTQSVRITVFDLSKCPKQIADQRTDTIFSQCTIMETFDVGPGHLDLLEFEVQIEFLSGVTSGIKAFVGGAQGSSFNLDPSNVFRHEELVPQRDPSPNY